MQPPLIGVTTDRSEKPGKYSLNADYAASIERAGGVPLAIPYLTATALIPHIVDRLDGILFIGGDDLDPALFGEARHPNAIPIDPRRTAFELALLAEVERRRTPTLGICFGSQLMNVYRGGSLHQFLPDLSREGALEHRRLGEEINRHPVTLDPRSTVGQAIGKREISANSFHKQSINRVGRGLRVIATAPDGVIEGIEDPELPLFAAVQWHPERLSEEGEHLALFRLLVDKAATRGRT